MALRHGEVRPVAGRLASAGEGQAVPTSCARPSGQGRELRQCLRKFKFGSSSALFGGSDDQVYCSNRERGANDFASELDRSASRLGSGLRRSVQRQGHLRPVGCRLDIVVFLPRSGNPTFRTNDTTATLRDTQVVGTCAVHPSDQRLFQKGRGARQRGCPPLSCTTILFASMRRCG